MTIVPQVLTWLIISANICNSFQNSAVSQKCLKHSSASNLLMASKSKTCLNQSSLHSNSNDATVALTRNTVSKLQIVKKISFEFSVVSVLIFLTSCTTGVAIVKAKEALSFIEKYRKLYRYPFPLIGGILISVIFTFRNDLHNSVGPAALYSNNVPYIRHILRVIAVIVSVGFGNSLAFVGIAAEMGMTISRLYLAMIFNILEIIENKKSYLIAFKAQCIRYMCVAGAAAGVAANFDAPLTGTLFALEVTRRLDPNFKIGYTEPTPTAVVQKSFLDLVTIKSVHVKRFIEIMPLVFVSIICSYLTVFSLRKRLTFTASIPHFLSKISYTTFNFHLDNWLQSMMQLSQFAGIGLLSGVVAFLFAAMRDTFSSQFFRKLPTRIGYLGGPILAGLLGTGMTALGLEQALPGGFVTMRQVLTSSEEMSGIKTLFIHFFERLSTVSFCVAVGLPGGVFSPSLFIGSSFGGFLHALVTSHAAMQSYKFLLSRSTYGVLAAAAVLSGIFQAPLVASFVIIELTRCRNLGVPLLIASYISMKCSTKLNEWRRNRFTTAIRFQLKCCKILKDDHYV